MNAWVARDRNGSIRAIVPDDPRKQGAIAGELAKWRRQGFTYAKEARAEAPQKVSA